MRSLCRLPQNERSERIPREAFPRFLAQYTKILYSVMLPKNYCADAKRRRRKGGGGGDGGWEMTNKIRNKTERSDRSVCLSGLGMGGKTQER